MSAAGLKLAAELTEKDERIAALTAERNALREALIECRAQVDSDDVQFSYMTLARIRRVIHRALEGKP